MRKAGVVLAVTAESYAEVVRATAVLLWPTSVIVALVLFRRQIRNLIDRVRRAGRGETFVEFAEQEVAGLVVELEAAQAATDTTEDAPAQRSVTAAELEDYSERLEQILRALQAAREEQPVGSMALARELARQGKVGGRTYPRRYPMSYDNSPTEIVSRNVGDPDGGPRGQGPS